MGASRATWDPQTDRYWGPFTYNTAPKSHHPLGVMLTSTGDDEDEGRCNLRFSGFGRTLIIGLPPIIKPWREWVDTSRYHWSDNPAGGYWQLHRREYGFSLTRSGGVGTGAHDFLIVRSGPQTNDSTTTRSWSKFLPWASWRHVRRSLYGLKGEHFWSEMDRSRPPADRDERLAFHTAWMEAARKAEEACPSVSFLFADFDGERVTARTHIEEREWRRGEGWFRWLSLFSRPLVKRSLDLRFSSGIGKRKDSWKGGTIGHAIEMRHGELHESAFRRYCAENRLTFIGSAEPSA